MGLEENKELVREYWRQINEKQSSEVLELCTDDFVFWFPGSDGGLQTREQARETFDSIFEIFPSERKNANLSFACRILQ